MKMRAAILLSPSSITQGRMGATKAALILMKHSHFDRTPQYNINFPLCKCKYVQNILEAWAIGEIYDRHYINSILKECELSDEYSSSLAPSVKSQKLQGGNYLLPTSICSRTYSSTNKLYLKMHPAKMLYISAATLLGGIGVLAISFRCM